MSTLKPGFYDQLVTKALRGKIADLPGTLAADLRELKGSDQIEYFARILAQRLREDLSGIVKGEDAEGLLLSHTNRLLMSMTGADVAEALLLTRVRPSMESSSVGPKIPLSQSALVTNDQGLNYHTILRHELLSSDRVDLICPFIGNQGINLIWDVLAAFGSRLRVVTTTYLGGTNQKALQRLVATGAEVKIIYERAEQKTSLHAKAWIFHRDSGFTTATIGSSNLSPKALVDGLEWNIKLGRADASQVLDELLVTFERLWQNPLFETFDPVLDDKRLANALKAQRSGADDSTTFFADLQPLPHQVEALGELQYARLEGKSENLIVAATGTGKTLLAAFDYQRFCAERTGRPRLLFVAHREDILKQSLGAFRAVMRDSDFGELHVGQQRADSWSHVFASVQSLSNRNLSEIEPSHFDYVVIDEFHHAEARTYLRLLDHFKPLQLVGLTATPERTDGRNVIDRFGKPTYELRLWHALERRLLCPFHYFGVDDQTDLSDLNWANGRYADSDLEKRYVDQGDGRAATIIRELSEKVSDLDQMHTVAFCATIRHAEYMAERFREAGLEARSLHSNLAPEVRKQLVQLFRRGELPIICTVDLFNEGVDIPEINTVLFLRPTESSTVFIQQLGRGLRNHVAKGALTVLDFVGQQNRKFRMDLRFQAMTGMTRTELTKAVHSDFPSLPPGCNIRLDRTTQERVLRNLRDAVPSTNASLIAELRRLYASQGSVSIAEFLAETGLTPHEFYRNRRSMASLMKAADLSTADAFEAHRASSFAHVDDLDRLRRYQEELLSDGPASAYSRMLAFSLTRTTSLSGLDAVLKHEVLDLLSALEHDAARKPSIAEDLPFALHAHYSNYEVVSPFREQPDAMRQGTFYVEELSLDIHIFTLSKSDRDFAPTTRYADYFLERDMIHWESQSTTTTSSPTGQRLINGTGRHLFFVREKRDDQGLTAAYLCLGFGRPVSYDGEKPIKLVWKLDHAVPDHAYIRLKNAAG